MKKVIFFSILVLSIFSLNIEAVEFQTLSSRATALGGSFTAVADDAIGAYWNPAGLANQTAVDIQIPFGINFLSTKDILKEADEIYKRSNNLNISSKTGNTLTAAEYGQALDFLKQAKDIDKPGAGLIVDANAGFNLRWRNFGLTLNSFLYVMGDPNVDMTNIAFGTGDDNVSSGDTVLTSLKTFADNNATGGLGGNTLTSDQTTLANSLATTIAASGIFNAATSNNLANELVYQAANTNYTVDGKTYTLDQSTLDFALPTLVQTAINIETGSSTANSIDSNLTNISLNGFWLTEVALSYGSSIKEMNIDWGVSLKAMKGTVGYYRQILKNDNLEMSDVKDDFDKTKKETTTFGIDLGFMYKMALMNTRIGLTLKNINSPKFDQPAAAALAGYGSEIKIDPSARLGVSLHPWRRLFLTSDIDLTENKTVMNNYKERNLGVGLEFSLLPVEKKNFNIALRAGYKTNLAESSAGGLLTGGIGFSFLHTQLDISGVYSTKKTQNEDGDDIPQEAGVSATLSLNF